MLQAVLRLVVLTFILIILGFFIVVGVRWMGSQQSFQPPHHPWFEREFWAIAALPIEELCAAKNLDQSPGGKWIVELPVKRKDEAWFVPCTEPLPLKDFLTRTAHRDFLLNVQAHDTWSLDQLLETAGAFDKTKNFAVEASSQKVAAYLRKKAPQWLFAADGASLLRLRTFTSFYMESAIDFWPDFVIADPHAKDLPQLDGRMANELDRRHKRILLKWFENDPTAPSFPIHGIMTDRPSAARKIWGKLP